MPRYIDADLILPEMESKLDMQELYLPAHFQEFIVDEIPTADVAPVVRCKDCALHGNCGAEINAVHNADGFIAAEELWNRRSDNG